MSTPVARLLERQPIYMETGFTRRLFTALDGVMRDREWQILVALPGDGKSWAQRRYVEGYPVYKADGQTMTRVLRTRVPQGGKSRNGLMYGVGRRFGLVLRTAPTFYFTMLTRWTAKGEVALIIIDDAHDLTKEPRLWLREFIDTLADGDDPEIGPVAVGVALVANGTKRGTARSSLFAGNRYRVDLDRKEFERRLGTVDPIVPIPGLDLDETGEALAGLDVLYRPQFPDLELDRYAEPLFEQLMDQLIDFDLSRRARIDSIVKCAVMAMTEEAEAGGWGEDIGPRLQKAVNRLKTRSEDLDQYSYRRDVKDEDE